MNHIYNVSLQSKPEVGKGISSESRGVAEAQGRNPLPTKGLDCKDIPISLLNKKKIREITVECTFEN